MKEKRVLDGPGLERHSDYTDQLMCLFFFFLNIMVCLYCMLSGILIILINLHVKLSASMFQAEGLDSDELYSGPFHVEM